MTPSWRAAASRAFSVTVSPRSVSTIGRVGETAAVDGRVVAALGGLDLEPERAQRGQVRLDGAGAEVAAAGVGQLEGVLAVHQRAEEHDDRAGTAGGLLVDAVEVELGRRDDLEVVVGVEPAGLHADAVEHLEEPVDLLDAGDPAQRGAAAVEQGRAQQRDAGVLRRLHVDRARQRGRPGDAQVGRPGAERDDLGVERLADAGEHLQGEVLVAALDAVDGALAGASTSASCCWVQPRCLRASRMRLPIRAR